MSVYEPKSVIALLRNSSLVPANERERFQTDWTNAVNKRVKTWSELPSQKKNPRSTSQLTWEAEVAQYVTFLWRKIRPHSKKNDVPIAISLDVPFFGPRFVPPTYLHNQRRSGSFQVAPDVQYLKPINIVHPLYYPELARCPRCRSSLKVTWEGWTATGACKLHGMFQEETALGLQLRCGVCKAEDDKAGEMTDKVSEADDKSASPAISGYCFATTNAAYWKKWEHWEIPRGLPIFFHRCAVTRELFDLIVELRPSSTSGTIAEQIKQLHLLEYHRRTLEYLEQLKLEQSKPKTVAAYFGRNSHRLSTFSPYADPQGYAGHSISDEMVSEVYLDFVERTRQPESEAYMRSLTVICGSLDSAFKVSNKATLTDKDCQRSKHLKGGILSILNEENQIISWRFCQTKSNAEIVEILTGLKRRIGMLGQPAPEMMVSDNCCAVQSALRTVFPQVDSIQDVWHFIARYMATIMNTSKNPLCCTVMADITNAILKHHAKDGDSGAEYWPRSEQEERLTAAYEKWSKNGNVWSAASLKVHQEQLKHVQRGCLERRRQDILSDGSRIEGCHKAWNMLQRAQPSGILMLSALSHDFVLRRNLRIAFRNKESGTFIEFTSGSHHLQLTNAIAQRHNLLLRTSESDQQSSPSMLPELHAADSGETFGLVRSNHSSSFGGFMPVPVKEEPAANQISTLPRFTSSGWELNSDDNGIVEQALDASRDVLVNDWKINPGLLDQPANPDPSTAVAAKPSLVPLDSESQPSSISKPLIPPPNTTTSVKRKADTSGAIDLSTIPAGGNGQGDGHQSTLESFFAAVSEPLRTSINPKPPKSRRMNSDTPASLALVAQAVEVDRDLAHQPPGPHVDHTPPTTRTTPPTCGEHNGVLPSGLLTTRRVQCTSGNTRSQQLFLLATGVPPESLTIKTGEEFYLFMDMRAEFGWVSYQMSSRRWVDATVEYNRRLVLKLGPTAMKKNPQALLQTLGRIEPRIIERILKNDYKSRHNTETFWRHHCSVIQLVKVDSTGFKNRKVHTCSRCQTIMYPGPEKSSLNHKRGVCADGVPCKSKDGEPLPPWPQPKGIFSGGSDFHINVFLDTVKRVHDQFVLGEPSGWGQQGLLILEAQAFVAMMQARTTIVSKSEDGATLPMALFKLYPSFEEKGSVPNGRIVLREGSKWLRITYLEEDLAEK